jgi:hypothetical protein
VTARMSASDLWELRKGGALTVPRGAVADGPTPRFVGIAYVLADCCLGLSLVPDAIGPCVAGLNHDSTIGTDGRVLLLLIVRPFR